MADGLSVGSQLKCAQWQQPRRRRLALSAVSHITHTQCEPSGKERARRLSTSFCWICLIKNDRREKRRRSRERAGAAELASGLWQLLCTFQAAYEGQLSVAEAPQEVASLLGQGCQTWARSGNLSCCCVIVREKCANRAQPKQKPSEALRPALPCPALPLLCLPWQGKKLVYKCVYFTSRKLQAPSGKLRFACEKFYLRLGHKCSLPRCPAASLLLLLATSCR